MKDENARCSIIGGMQGKSEEKTLNDTTTTKKCNKCKVVKSFDDFNKNPMGKFGLKSCCKLCDRLRYRTYQQLNKNKIRKKNSLYRATSQRFKEYQLDYGKRRRKADPSYRIARNLRTRLWHFVKGKSKNGSAVRDLGCSIADLMLHLSSQFKSGMTWENYGEWEIDHIQPLSKFDLTDRNQLLVACHFTNLQPLWEAENLRKSDN